MSDYVTRFLNKLEYYEDASDGWIALCPVAGHGCDGEDSTPSLRITIGDEGRILVTCRVGCDLDDVLHAMNFTKKDLYPMKGEAPAEPMTHSLTWQPLLDSNGSGSPNPLALRHTVYSHLLSLLPLEADHEAQLLTRGLDHQSIQAGGFRSGSNISLNDAARSLYQVYGGDLYSVPGFISEPEGGACINGNLAGLLVPVRDPQGNILSLKVRRDSDQIPRYLTFSSSEVHSGLHCHCCLAPLSSHTPSLLRRGSGKCPTPLTEGDSSLISNDNLSPLDDSPVSDVLEGELSNDLLSHSSLSDRPLGTDGTLLPFCLRVIEGELKAEVCHHKTSIPTIGIPGVTNWVLCLPLLQSLAPDRVLIAFDWPDVLSKPPVCQQLLAFCLELQAQGYDFSVEYWDSSHKGLDDLLSSGGCPMEMPGPTAISYLQSRLQPPNPGPSKGSFSPAKDPDPGPVDCRLPFPTGIFPPAVQDFIQEISLALPCPEDFVGASLLPVIGATIGTTRVVQMKDTWQEYPLLYLAIIAPPGALKTPAMNSAIKPLKKINEVLHKRSREKYKQWEASLDLYKMDKTIYLLKKKHYERFKKSSPDLEDPDPPAPVPPPPAQEVVLYDDATIEALAEVLSRNLRGGIWFNDELIAWLNGMNQYRGGKGTDRQFWMKTWQCQEYSVLRKHRLHDPVHLEHPFLCVLGSIQPELLSDLGDIRGREDGFLARLLFSMPECVASPPLDFSRDVNPSVLTSWDEILNKLRLLNHAEEELPKKKRTDPTYWKKVPRVLSLTPAAEQAFQDWHEDLHSSEVNHPDFNTALRASWSKFKAYASRFCLILHYLREACGELPPGSLLVDETTVQKAITLTEYFKSHTAYVFNKLKPDPRDRFIPDFIKWLWKQGKGAPVSVRDIYRLGRWGLRKKSDTLKFLKYLEDTGHGHFDGALGKNNHQVIMFAPGPPPSFKPKEKP